MDRAKAFRAVEMAQDAIKELEITKQQLGSLREDGYGLIDRELFRVTEQIFRLKIGVGILENMLFDADVAGRLT